MLSISTTDGLSILDFVTIKRIPPSVPPCLTFTHKVVASTWSSDNAFLFLASLQTIQRYDPSSNSLKEFYSNVSEGEISNLVSKDKGSLIFSSGKTIHLLDCGSTPKVSQTFDTHKSPITSLSLSSDASLLSSTSSTAAHVHNLSLASHTVLRGLPLGGQPITSSVFQPQLRTRLLLGIGKQLVVYDTTRPSGPMKTIALNETNSGDIIAIACSPFSKTLVAVATTGGNVVLIDLEKEKGIIRTLNLKVPLTSLEFSPEGAAIYAGTENGKLLITDLRGLDKGPKIIVISDVGSRIESMSIQKKTRGGIDPDVKQLKSKSSTDLNGMRRATQTSKPATKVVPSPSRARTARVGSEASPARRVPSILKEGAPGPSPKRTADPESKKKVFSPVRDPLGNSGSVGDISVEIEVLGGLKTGIKATPKKPSVSVPRSRSSVSPKVNSSPTTTSAKTVTSRKAPPAAAKEDSAEVPRRARTLPTTRTRKPSTTESADSRPTVPQLLQVPTEEVRQRPRTASSASRPGSSASAVSSQSAHMRPESSTSNSRPGSSTSRAESSPIPQLPASGTVSPDLPAIHGEPTTPVPMAKKRKGMSVLGLGTPEMERWIRAGKGDIEGKVNDKGKGKGKTVGFTNESDSENEDGSGGQGEREQGLAMQVSPRRSTDVSATSWASAPLHAPVPGSGSPAGGAHDLLRTIVRDVMYDFQRETKAEMMGLHLDLVRMGRGWKKELRDLMGEYVGDLKDLREDNRRLREENERLRRGY